MDEKEFQFGVPEGVNETTLHPLGLAAILVFGCAVLFLPRRYALIPMILTACFIAPAQRVAIFTLNFTLLRIMVVFAVTRLLARGELRGLRWQPLDTVFIAFAVSATVAHILLYASAEAVKYRSGWLFDALGMYFLFRALVRDWRDLDTLIAGFALIALPVAGAFLIENRTGHNLFAFFGGVPEQTVVRQGRLRCQGAFAHPILAGCFWASVLPLIAARLWDRGKNRLLTLAGISAALVTVVLCASSTPVSSTLLAAAAGLLVMVRWHMRYVRWGLVATLIVLHIVMHHPVWYLFAKIDFAGGSTGWHRYWLIDIFVRNFADWWLIGTRNPLAWCTPGSVDFVDVTNQYVFEAMNGGLVTLSLFIAVIVTVFHRLGVLWRRVEYEPPRLALAWALGVAIFVHTINFCGVSYCGQITLLWYGTVAIAGSLVRQCVPRRSVEISVHSLVDQAAPAKRQSQLTLWRVQSCAGASRCVWSTTRRWRAAVRDGLGCSAGAYVHR